MRRLGLAVGLSGLVHAAIAGSLAALLADRQPARPRSGMVPLDVVEAPAVPVPPEAPAAEPTTPPPPPAPKPRRRPRPRVVTTETGLPVAADAGTPADAGALAETPAEPDAGEAPDGGSGVAGGGDKPPAKLDPGVLDLRGSVPPGERVMLALRTDRLRGTPWADAIQAILAPMPDYRFVLEGTGLGIADTFDTVVIASPAPRDVTQTFLAGRTARDDAGLRRLLARGAAGPRVVWSPVAGGTVGRRTDPRLAAIGDPRVLLAPAPGWFLLIRPEHVVDQLQPQPAEATPPPWLDALARVDDQLGEALAVVVVADLGAPTLLVPGLGLLPAPDRMTIAVTTDEKGLILTGAAVFPDEPRAQAFLDAVLGMQRDLLGSFGRRLLLRGLSADGAATRLQLARHGVFVTFATSVTNAEAAALLEQAAAMSRRVFQPWQPAQP